MLFVIVMEALNWLIREADHRRVLSPLPGGVTAHRASLYADDLVVLLSPKVENLNCLHQILQLFARASGLVTNVDKCVATPIRCTDEMVTEVQQVFPCVLAPFPFKYLGIPLSLTRLRRADEHLLVDSISSRIPTCKSGLLTNAGHTLLTKVTLSAIPVHISIACCLSEWAISQNDKRIRAFLWTGLETVLGGKCRVTWTRVCRPTCLGGLGVVDLCFFGYALRLRWEWLLKSEPERCWVKLPARLEKPVAAMAVVSMSVVHDDGGAALFWTDNWSSVGPPLRPATLCNNFQNGSQEDAQGWI